jgi:hypothetical protein
VELYNSLIQADAEDSLKLATTLKDFTYNIFSYSIEPFYLNDKYIPGFVGGDFVDNVCRFYDNNDMTFRMCGRDHFKSMSLYVDIMRDLFTIRDRNIEGQYYSYSTPMAVYHIKKIKRLIQLNHFFRACKDLKPKAESILEYTWDGKHIFSVQPQGLLTFTRGIHSDRIYLDDALKDPDNQLILTNIDKINKIVKAVVFPMLKKGGKFRIVGTPQSSIDFYFDHNALEDFETLITPAIVYEDDRRPQDSIVAWPEWMTYDELCKRRRKLGRLFGPEYMCTPVYAENAFFTRQQIQNIAIHDCMKELQTKNDMVLTWDIGKKVHPSHVSILEWTGKKAIQRYQKFLDGMDYTNQVRFVNNLWDDFSCNVGCFDASRGEIDPFIEQHMLPSMLKPISFTRKQNKAMATSFDQFVSEDKLELINNERMINQILVVDNDLKAPETAGGHGDSFWTIAMGCWCIENYCVRQEFQTADLSQLRNIRKARTGRLGGLTGIKQFGVY